MGGHTHNCARSICHQNVIANQDRHFIAANRINNMPSGKKTNFRHFLGGALNFADTTHTGNKSHYLFFMFCAFNQLMNQGVLRSKDH